MFTSRAEFRLSLRADNADQRLTAKGRGCGCVGDGRWSSFTDKMAQIGEARELLGSISLSSREIAKTGTKLNADGPRRSALEALALADFGFEQLAQTGQKLDSISGLVRDQVKKDALYAHYIARQERDIVAMERDEKHIIPEMMDFSLINGLSNELVTKLTASRPATIAQAGRIEGMTPAALMLIIGATKRRQQQATGT
jgi:tRNA uridine 5-carboxymethylaminomethyl modification enzyme